MAPYFYYIAGEEKEKPFRITKPEDGTPGYTNLKDWISKI